MTCGFSAGQSATAGSIGYHEEVSPTLRAASSGTNQAPSIVYRQHNFGEYREGVGTLTTGAGIRHPTETIAVVPPGLARRLTPLECERLQGYPDGWTDIPDYIDSKGRTRHAVDTSRYKALGNSIALPCAEYVLQGILDQFGRGATLGSLFDGIGGFPLIWETISGTETARWASEIEDFPLAVTECKIGGKEK